MTTKAGVWLVMLTVRMNAAMFTVLLLQRQTVMSPLTNKEALLCWNVWLITFPLTRSLHGFMKTAILILLFMFFNCLPISSVDECSHDNSSGAIQARIIIKKKLFPYLKKKRFQFLIALFFSLTHAPGNSEGGVSSSSSRLASGQSSSTSDSSARSAGGASR